MKQEIRNHKVYMCLWLLGAIIYSCIMGVIYNPLCFPSMVVFGYLIFGFLQEFHQVYYVMRPRSEVAKRVAMAARIRSQSVIPDEMARGFLRRAEAGTMPPQVGDMVYCLYPSYPGGIIRGKVLRFRDDGSVWDVKILRTGGTGVTLSLELPNRGALFLTERAARKAVKK